MSKMELMKAQIDDYTKWIREEREHKRVLNELLDRMWNEFTDEEKEAVIHGIVLVDDKIRDLVAKWMLMREKLMREKLKAEEMLREEQGEL